jgi:hypothetical protein
MTKPVIEVPISNPQPQPLVNFTLSTDTLLIGGVLVWALWDKVMKPKVTEKLDGVFAPVEEERRLTNILAQIGIVTKASRVVLAAFHNGALDNAGYHLQKLSTVNAYTSPGNIPMNYPIRDLPIGRIMFEIEAMLKANDWVCVQYAEDLPQPCKDHLIKNDIQRMCNRLVKVGNLPIGILSLQYSKNHRFDVDDETCCNTRVIRPEYETLMDDLYLEISTIMRRRVIHPSPIHRVFGTLLGTLKVKK